MFWNITTIKTVCWALVWWVVLSKYQHCLLCKKNLETTIASKLPRRKQIVWIDLETSKCQDNTTSNDGQTLNKLFLLLHLGIFCRLRAPSYFVNTETPEVSCVYILTSHPDSLHRVSSCSWIFFLRVWCCNIGRKGAASPPTLLASWRRWPRRTSRPRWASRSRSRRSSSTPSMSPFRWGSSQPETNRG